VTNILNTPIDKFAQNIAAKGFPLPESLAYLTYFAESVAAACLAIGLFTRIAAAVIGIEMLVIVFVFQWQFGYFWTNRGYEFALLWALLCIAIFQGRRPLFGRPPDRPGVLIPLQRLFRTRASRLHGPPPAQAK
jgi:uncharacterized membrane protein YphA (DoxX/SURF4 family)